MASEIGTLIILLASTQMQKLAHLFNDEPVSASAGWRFEGCVVFDLNENGPDYARLKLAN